MTKERNKRYFAKTGYGFGQVMSQQKHVNAIRSLTKRQLNALIYLLLFGDTAEVGIDELLVGRWTLKDKELNTEAEWIMQNVAALVYLSGRLAKDFPVLVKDYLREAEARDAKK